MERNLCVRELTGKWLMAYKCRSVWYTHIRTFSRWICNKEFGMAFNLILVRWDIEVHSSILQKENHIKIRPLKWDSIFFLDCTKVRSYFIWYQSVAIANIAKGIEVEKFQGGSSFFFFLA